MGFGQPAADMDERRVAHGSWASARRCISSPTRSRYRSTPHISSSGPVIRSRRGPVGPGGPARGAGTRSDWAGRRGWSRWHGRSLKPRRTPRRGTRGRLIRRITKAVKDAYGQFGQYV